ncbi:endonuclease III-like protein 1 [Leptopilina heterotoma]|uniref:endonuclease III-like protein 1 n=1 Tax=Leptopilina heterotoma TaxID=63436 RepID=UPI001CA8D53F|nr:endonuclease III-like protein 1 [Leptopilina heterotoma]
MSKKLKLETLSKTRSLRTRKVPEKSDDLTAETSQFFDNNAEDEKHSKSKKRTPIKIQCDDDDVKDVEVEKHSKAKSRKRSPIKCDDDVKDVEVEKQSKSKSKKRSPIKIQCDEDVKEENEILSKGSKDNWMPKNWEALLKNIREMRKDETAPVDEMGCHKCADTNVSKPIFRYQSLLALMLSSQTKDQVTHAAMQRLKEFGCTPDSIIAASDEELGKLIYPVSFWKRKVEYLKKTSAILKEKYNNDIPDSAEKLCELPGVGPKMAHICMQVAWDKISGIGVDTHVHRIANRLGWVKKMTKTPEDTRKRLESWLPKELWADVNHLLVGFGQTICTPQRPKCTECLNKDICPFVRKK